MSHRVGRAGWISRQDVFYALLLHGIYKDSTPDYRKFSKHMDQRARDAFIAKHKIGKHQSADVFFKWRKRRPRR